MKISRLHIDQFAVEDYPTIAKDDIGGEDLLIKGENRSGKTLTVNALLYVLYGPRATLGIQPGHKSVVDIQFDNNHQLHRSGRGRSYNDGDTVVKKEGAEEQLINHLGPEAITTLQFVHSETDKLPLSRLSGQELIQTIRRLVRSDLQDQLEQYREERDSLNREIEQVQRTELKPVERELREIDVSRFKSRLKKIEHLQSLIETGRIKIIKQRLLENEELNEELDRLYTRKRTIEQELRKKNRKLREERHYTQEVNDLIIDAIEELSCPVCDHVVEEQTARHRLKRGKCPQCGQNRSMEDLKANLREKVNTADDAIEELENEIAELEEEESEIEDKIESTQDVVPDLSDLNDLTKLTLKENNYDLGAVTAETEEELENHREEIDRLTTRKEALEDELENVEELLGEMQESLDQVREQIAELREKSFVEVVGSFQDEWSSNYEKIASELGLEIRIEKDGTVLLPGNEGSRKYSELSTGEARLLNISFAHTVATVARDNGAAENSFEVVVLDEPFANLEEDQRDTALEFVDNTDVQYFIASSNEELQRHFDPHQVVSLQTMSVQLTWDQINE